VRLSGPEQHQLAMTALSADGVIIAAARLVQARSGIVLPIAATQFRCKANHIDIGLQDIGSTPYAQFPETVSIETTHFELFRGNDGSLILLQEARKDAAILIVPFRTYKHRWYRFVPVADVPLPAESSKQ
jgi:hypothetical protein